MALCSYSTAIKAVETYDKRQQRELQSNSRYHDNIKFDRIPGQINWPFCCEKIESEWVNPALMKTLMNQTRQHGRGRVLRGLGGKKGADREWEGQMLGVGVSQISITTSAARESAINCEIWLIECAASLLSTSARHCCNRQTNKQHHHALFTSSSFHSFVPILWRVLNEEIFPESRRHHSNGMNVRQWEAGAVMCVVVSVV